MDKKWRESIFQLFPLSMVYISWPSLFKRILRFEKVVLCCVLPHTKNKLCSLNFEGSVSFRKWWKFAHKNGVRGGRIKWCSYLSKCKSSEEPMFIVFVHYSTDLSMMLVWTYSVDPNSVDIFHILPDFLWQPLLSTKCVINVFFVNFDQDMNLKLMKMWSLTRGSLME